MRSRPAPASWSWRRRRLIHRPRSCRTCLNAVNTARNTAGVVAVSMSWGFNEMQNESSFDSYFTTPAGHQGVTFIAASGDSGIVEYPSASPNVLSVGGTTLNLTGSGAYSAETAWFSGGGGYSSFEQEPSYQGTVQTSGARSTPDVAFDADPNTGVEVYSTAPGARSGSWQVVGGTSLGSPAWAGIIAIVDQGRALAGQGSLDGATQTLPALYAAASSNFNSVASSSTSPYGGFSFGGFNPFGGSAGTSGISSSFWGGFGWGLGLGTIGNQLERSDRQHIDRAGHTQGRRARFPTWSQALSRRRLPPSATAAAPDRERTPTIPTEPTKPVGRARSTTRKHGHVVTKHTTHAKHVSERKLVNQAHTSATHVSGIRLV